MDLIATVLGRGTIINMTEGMNRAMMIGAIVETGTLVIMTEELLKELVTIHVMVKTVGIMGTAVLVVMIHSLAGWMTDMEETIVILAEGILMRGIPALALAHDLVPGLVLVQDLVEGVIFLHTVVAAEVLFVLEHFFFSDSLVTATGAKSLDPSRQF